MVRKIDPAKNFLTKPDGSLLTPSFRVSFPYVFSGNKDGKKGLAMIFEKDIDFTFLEQAIQEAITKKWNNKPPKNLMLPILDGDNSDREEYQDKMYVNGKIGKYGCGVVDAQRQPLTDAEEFYPGCHARAVITCYAWGPYMGKHGISVNVRSLQKLRDDEPLVTRVSAENDFEDVENFDGEDL